jgi:heme a synthase
VKVIKFLWFDIIAAKARLRLYLWLSLITQILIVVTGGLVRLTASGLGCPTWPKCTEDSLITTQEMGFHGIIEFGNRLLTFVLLVISILMFAVAMRLHSQTRQLLLPTWVFFSGVIVLVAFIGLNAGLGFSILIVAGWIVGLLAMGLGGYFFVRLAKRAERKGILVPAFGLGLGIIVQAVIGGVTVLTGLNPWIVGLHFVVSGVLIATATTMFQRGLPSPVANKAKLAISLAWPTSVVGTIAVLFGIVVTGAGPHAGDIDTPRNGLDLEVWQHYHSYPGYLMLALITLQLFSQLRVDKSLSNPITKTLVLLFVGTVVQAAIGVIQSRLGVPPLLVGAHMLGAAVLISLLTLQLLRLRDKR